MEAIKLIAGICVVFLGLILIVLLILLPVFVMQISNSVERSEKLLKKAIVELEKINAYLTPPPAE